MEIQRQQHVELDQFVVKVKLLTNQVYEFTIKQNVTKVQDLKKMIEQKLKIPIDRQRIVFGGKALVDSNNVTQYVKQSGMTVHLIAKMASTTTDTNTTNTQSNTNNQANSNQNRTNNNPNIPNPNINTSNQTNSQQNQNIPPNPFSNIFQMVLGGPQQQTSMSFNNIGDLNSSLSGILGGLGIPIRTGANLINIPQNRTPTNLNSQVNQNPNPPVNSFQTPVNETRRQANQNNNQTNNQPSNQTQPNRNTVYNVSNQPILNINAAISQLNLPPQPVRSNHHLNLREQTAQYLRRLQHQMMRMIPQLNRGIQLLNEGRVTHMTGFIPLFQRLNVANEQAIRAIRRLNNLPIQNVNQNINVQSQQNNSNNSNQNIQNQVNVQATIIIGSQGNNQNQQRQQNQDQNQNQEIDDDGDFADIPRGQIRISSNSNFPPGFNLNGLLSGLLGGQGLNQQINRNTTNTTTNNSQSQSQNQSFNLGSLLTGQNLGQQNSQQGNSNPLGMNLGSMANMMFNPNPSANNIPQTSNNNSTQPNISNNSNQQPINNSNQNANNPFGGINIMQMFSQLNQTGGIGQIMSMSLGQMLDEGAEQPSVYGQLFRGINGQDLMGCLTTRNLQFLDRKYDQFRQNLLKAIAIEGSRQDLITKISQDLQKLLVPRDQNANIQECTKKVRVVIRRRIQQLVSVTLNKQNTKYSDRIIAIMKFLLCQSIDQTLPYVNQHSQEIVFNNIKINIVTKLEEFIPGLSGMLYSFIQKDLIRVYKQHKIQQQRKQKRSEEQKLNQENLLQAIQNQSKKDIEYMKNLKHSQYYYPK